jgi:L-lactate dehydrogenase complex protein LldG
MVQSAARQTEPWSQIDAADAVETFRTKVEPLGVRVERVDGTDGAAAFLVEQAAEAETVQLVFSGELTERSPGLVDRLAEAGLEIVVSQDLEDPRDAPLGVTLAKHGVVETGSALMAERTPADRAVGLLTMTCVIVIEMSSLLPTLNDAAKVLREIAMQPKGGFATLITGPSRTADIEMSLTVGVQGPRVVRVLFVDSLE